MARARNLKPGFFSNEDLAECSFPARLCFAGLWTLADREGRLENRPKRIKGELFRFDSIEVEPLLDELEAHGFVERYRIDGASFIQILMFKKHQTPHYSEKPSVIKPPPLRESKAHQGTESSGHEDPDAAENSKRTPGVDPPSRGGRNPLNPDSLNPDSLNHESKHAQCSVSKQGTRAGSVCRALRASGISEVNPGHPTLIALLEAGATDEEFLGAASKAAGKRDPFSYLLSVVEGQRRDAKQLGDGVHRGPMPKREGTDRKSRQLTGAAVLTGAHRSPPETVPETIDVESRIVPTRKLG